jgi:hypothetical protein
MSDMRSWALLVALAAGCGRFGFSGNEPPGDAAGMGDGRRGDGAVDSSPDAALYACTGSELCSDFENGTGLWMADPMVTIDTTRAHRGLQSVHVHSPAFGVATDSYHSLYESATVTANINPFYVRAWLWLSALPATNNAMELITAERPGSAGDYVFVHSDRTAVYSQYDTTIMNTTTLIPTGGWFCLVWKVTRDTGTAGRLDLTGDVTVSLVGSKTDSSATPMQYVTIGLGYSGTNVATAQPAQDLWIDDVIVAGTAVTCSD